MTFSPEHWCHLVAGFARPRGEEEYTAGQADALNITLVSEGTAALFDTPQRILPEGSLVVAGQPVRLRALGSLSLCGVVLGGQAPWRAAQSLPGPLVYPAGGCSEAAEMVFRLWQSPAGTRQSAASFALLCALGEADCQKPEVPALVQAALLQIHTHYGEVYGVEELAEALGVSKGHLIRSFRLVLGFSPGRCLTLTRIEAAKRLLAQERLSLEAVAGLCGFSGANYLCRVFKKEVGKSPAAWQKAHGKAENEELTEEVLWGEEQYL